jgi:hypothetical protein
MGPPENPIRRLGRQGAAGRKRSACRPRTRLCLLKGCDRRFHPLHFRQRYCSRPCRQAARAWSEWKARQAYRATAAAKQKRKHQSQRYRERVKERESSEKRAVGEAARVITKKFFRRLLPPAWLLPVLRALAAIAAATLLLALLPARHGAGPGTGAALANQARLAVPPPRTAACAATMKAAR